MTRNSTQQGLYKETLMNVTKEMVDRFLTWPLPASVCADRVASMPGEPHRSGTNLLSSVEARAMLEHVLAETLA